MYVNVADFSSLIFHKAYIHSDQMFTHHSNKTKGLKKSISGLLSFLKRELITTAEHSSLILLLKCQGFTYLSGQMTEL